MSVAQAPEECSWLTELFLATAGNELYFSSTRVRSCACMQRASAGSQLRCPSDGWVCSSQRLLLFGVRMITSPAGLGDALSCEFSGPSLGCTGWIGFCRASSAVTPPKTISLTLTEIDMDAKSSSRCNMLQCIGGEITTSLRLNSEFESKREPNARCPHYVLTCSCFLACDV